MAYNRTGDRYKTHLLSQGSRGRYQFHTAPPTVVGCCIKLIPSLAALVEQVSITDTSLKFPSLITIKPLQGAIARLSWDFPVLGSLELVWVQL